MKNLLTWLALFLCVLQVNAQTTPPPATKADFKLFFEKVYLHTDREYYSAGEDIWFKAYLLNAQYTQLFNASNNLYVELIGPKANVVDSKLIRLDDGMGKGDFKLTDSIPPGAYRLRAYTNWMLNFGDNFIFEKELHIYNDIKSVAKVAVADPKKQKSVKAIAIATGATVMPVKPKAAAIRFFPEGGSMIESVAGVVAFKAEDANGKGMMVKGGIYAADGEKITDIESNASGMGSFTLQPIAGKKYEARGTYPNNQSFVVALPGALLKGFSVNTRVADTTIKVIISTNVATLQDIQGRALKLQGKNKGQTLFASAVPVKDLQTTVSVSKSSLRAGVNELTLVDADGKPQCERLFYIDGTEKAGITLSPDKTVYAAREKVNLHIKTTDKNGAPVKAQLSVAVVDAGLIPQNDADIVSYINLQSELRGAIENPRQYFDEANPQRKQALDLLLLTQGWRDFVWKRLADSAIRISYDLEQGITVTGRVRGIWFDKPVANMNITMMANGAKGSKLFSAQTNAKGTYAIYGLNLYGNQEVSLSSTNGKGSQTGLIVGDTALRKPYIITPGREIVDSAYAYRFNDEIIKRNTTARKFRITDTTLLKEVNIRSNGLEVHKKYIDTMLTVMRADYKLKTLYDYIIDKFPAAFMAPTTPHSVYFFGINNTGRYVKMAPKFTAEGVPTWQTRAIMFYDIPMDQIISVHFQKINLAQRPTITQGTAGFRLGDNYWFELKLKPHALDGIDLHTTNFDVEGYYEARTFYAPSYSAPDTRPDYRTTINWQPMVTTQNGEAIINWYNADPKTKVRIVAEGITDKGVPVSGVVTYEVK